MRAHPATRSSALLLILSTVAVILVAPAVPFAQLLPIETFGVAQGLTSSDVRAVEQDHRGQLWLGLRTGLATFDGKDFTAVDLPFSVGGVDIGTLDVDDSGRVCAASRSLPLRVACETDRGWWVLPDFSTESDPGDLVHALAVSRGDGWDSVAVLTDRMGLLVFEEGAWRRVAAPTGIRFHDIVYRGRSLLLAASRGVYRLDPGSTAPVAETPGFLRGEVVAFSSTPGAPADDSSPIWVLGQHWIGTLRDGEISIVHDNLTVRSLGHPDERPVLGIGPFGGFYFGTGSGLSYLDPETGAANPIGRQNGLIGEGVLDVMVDRFNQVWIAGARGLSKITSRRFENYSSNEGLLEDEVTALVSVDGGGLLIGHNHGLSMFKDGRFRTVEFAGTPDDVEAWSRVMEFARAPEGVTWGAAVEMGLVRISSDLSVSWVKAEAGLRGPVVSIEIDRDGGRWAVDDGHLVFSPAGSDRFREVAVDPSVIEVRRVVSAPDGTIYALTRNGLVFGQPGAWTIARAQDPKQGANVLYSVMIRDQDSTLVGTAAGLYELHGTALEQVELGSRHLDRPVYEIVSDSRECLWFGTDDGLFKWDGVALRHLSVRQGLSGHETNRGALQVEANGDLWVGTDRGLSNFRSRLDAVPDLAPAVEFMGIETRDRRLESAAGISLDPEENDVCFHFRIISLATQYGLRYKFQLDGYDREWSVPRDFTTGERHYTNLGPGRYVFRVRAALQGGPWSEVVSSPEVILPPPWWQTRTFVIALLSAIFLTTAATLGLLRSRRHTREHDLLTGLVNRRTLYRRLDRAFERAVARGDREIAVLLLKLDRFRLVTQSLGREAGQRLIVEVARRLRTAVPSHSLLGRLEADDFALVIDRLPSREESRAVAMRLLATLARPVKVDDHDVFTSASVGIAMGPENRRWSTNLLRDADIAVHEAQRRGLGEVVIFDRSMHDRAYGRLKLEGDLRRAIDEQEFELHFQPIVDLDGLELKGLEALLRWRRSTTDYWKPGQFLTIAEDSGLIIDIGEWVLEESVRTIHEWSRGVFAESPVVLHVNLSSRQFDTGDLPARFNRILGEVGVSGDLLCLELTESLTLNRTPDVLRQIEALRKTGAGLAIDDFGAGHSSLEYVGDLGIDTLKLDRSFMTRASATDQGWEIVETLVSLGRSLGLQVIVEGVEDRNQHLKLKEIGCPLAQGFLYARPAAAAVVEEAFKSGNLIQSEF